MTEKELLASIAEHNRKVNSTPSSAHKLLRSSSFVTPTDLDELRKKDAERKKVREAVEEAVSKAYADAMED